MKNYNELTFLDKKAVIMTMPENDLADYIEFLAYDESITNFEYCILYQIALDRLRGC